MGYKENSLELVCAITCVLEATTRATQAKRIIRRIILDKNSYLYKKKGWESCKNIYLLSGNKLNKINDDAEEK